VSDRSSVPKEVVYPRFDALGTLWVSLSEEYTLLKARQKTFQQLTKYRLSFNPTLSEEAYVINVNSSSVDSAEDEPSSSLSKVDVKMSIIDSIKAERQAEAALREKTEPQVYQYYFLHFYI
jgi:Domain of unknown function